MSTPDRKRILCIEDDQDSCDMLVFLLGDHDVATARTVKTGVELARNRPFDLYVLDGIYPDGSGIELCILIRSFDNTAPILFFSGLTDESVIDRALRAGAQAYLKKPDDIEELVSTVERLLKAASQD
jgi:two-component system, NtrC family, response regulator